MGRFAIFGIILPMRQRWKGTRVGVKTGFIKPSALGVPYYGVVGLTEESPRSTLSLRVPHRPAGGPALDETGVVPTAEEICPSLRRSVDVVAVPGLDPGIRPG